MATGERGLGEGERAAAGGGDLESRLGEGDRDNLFGDRERLGERGERGERDLERRGERNRPRPGLLLRGGTDTLLVKPTSQSILSLLPSTLYP